MRGFDDLERFDRVLDRVTGRSLATNRRYQRLDLGQTFRSVATDVGRWHLERPDRSRFPGRADAFDRAALLVQIPFGPAPGAPEADRFLGVARREKAAV